MFQIAEVEQIAKMIICFGTVGNCIFLVSSCREVLLIQNYCRQEFSGDSGKERSC
jgi:hypothetical protein